MAKLSEKPERDTGKDWRRPTWRHSLLILPCVMWAGFLLYKLEVYRHAAKRQQTAFGTVTAHDPANHSRYGYTFTVTGRRYDGWQVPVDSEKWAVGQQVVVYYDAADPGRNSLEHFTP